MDTFHPTRLGKKGIRPQILWRVDAVTGCWDAIITRPDGRATFKSGETRWYAYRWMYERLVGPIPAGLVIDHSCENTSCLNPEHMVTITQAEHARRHRATQGPRGKDRAPRQFKHDRWKR